MPNRTSREEALDNQTPGVEDIESDSDCEYEEPGVNVELDANKLVEPQKTKNQARGKNTTKVNSN